MTPLQTAAAAVVDHLADTAGIDVAVAGDDVPELTSSTALVRCRGAEWALHRTHVEVSVEIWATTADPRLADAERRRLADAVYSAIQTLDGDVWWAGAGTRLAADLSDDGQTIDGIPWATGTVDCTVVVDHDVELADGSVSDERARLEQVLRSAGLPAVTTADRGQALIVRGLGTDPEDPRIAQLRIWCIAPADSGLIDGLAAAAHLAVWAAPGWVAGAVEVDLSSSAAPGSALVHDIATIDVLALPSGDDA